MNKLILVTLLLCASSIYASDGCVTVKTGGVYIVGGQFVQLQTTALSSKHSSYNKPNEDTRINKPSR